MFSADRENFAIARNKVSAGETVAGDFDGGRVARHETKSINYSRCYRETEPQRTPGGLCQMVHL